MRAQPRAMGLADIASGVCVTDEQRERGVATVDRTADSLAERLAPHAEDLPCEPPAAARVVERYAAGGSVGEAAAAGDVARVTAAKTLHLLGESVSPLGPTGREVVRDWIAGDLSRSEAISLSRASPEEFALAAFVETHEPLPDCRDAVEGAIDACEFARAHRRSVAGAAAEPDDLR